MNIEVIAIVRRCKACGQYKPIGKFRSQNKTCAQCIYIHHRGWVLTEYGRQSIQAECSD